MVKLGVKNIRAGMVVGEDTKDLNGRMLLKKNQILTDKHIQILKKWGVPKVSIIEPRIVPTSVSENKRNETGRYFLHQGIPDEIFSEAKKHCLNLYRLNDKNDPLVSELYNLSIYYISKKIE